MKPTAKPQGFNRPRQSLQLVVFSSFALWQTLPTTAGILLYMVLVKILKLHWVWLTGLSALVLTMAILSALVHTGTLDVGGFVSCGFYLNLQFWEGLFVESGEGALSYLSPLDSRYAIGIALFLPGFLALLDLIPNSAHETKLRLLHRGKVDFSREKSSHSLHKALARLNGVGEGATVLGISKVTGLPVLVPDKVVNQQVLILGTTGAGKTVTLKRFYEHAIANLYPLIIIDGKPSSENSVWLEERCVHYQRKFYGFNAGNFAHYDCLAHGGYTELKDKIISLKDEWQSEYYRSIAEDYLQTTFAVLLKSGQDFDLARLIACLDHDELLIAARSTQDKALLAHVKRLENYDQKDITGLQAHLSLLIHSELGDYFKKDDHTFNLAQVIGEKAIAYFALPALRFPTFSKVLGKLIINDVKTVIDRNVKGIPIFCIFDEFSVFAGDQVLNLVNMGRAKGIHAIFGTQGVADLKGVSPEFSNQILNCVNTLICHGVNDEDSAETVARWIGTHDVFDVTAQVDMNKGGTGLGSVSRNKEFLIHPDQLKRELAPGDAFYISKVGGFRMDKVKVKFS